jgi:hypothetical protein
MDILSACDDPNLFGPWFKDRRTWAAWRAFLAALFALPMTRNELQTYADCTGRLVAPSTPANEAWLICGRRAGKSFNMGLIAVFLACFKDYREYLQPGERAMILVLATDKRQARVIARYLRALITRIPMLARMIERETAEGFDLKNLVSIEIVTASYRATRGYTIAAALCDEIAFWPTDDAAEPDYAVLDALRPGMATIPSAMLLCASSPYAKAGALYDAHKRHFGKDGPVLVWKAPTRTMNPNVKQALIDAAVERDPASAASEYMAEFRNDIAAFVDRETVLSCVDQGTKERPFASAHRYVAFVDPSGGSVDSMTLAIGHAERDMIITDCLRERPAPFDPESTVEEFAALLRSYGVTQVTGDRYSGQWCQQSFEKRKIKYVPSETPKSGLYTDLLPKLMAKRMRLVDNTRLVNQLASLERRTARGGRDSIDHPPSGHDDLANAIAGLATVASAPRHFFSRTELVI